MTLIYVGNNSAQGQVFAFNASGQIRRTSDNTWQSVPASSTATTNYKITVAGIDGVGAHYVDTANLPADWTRLELRTIGGTDTFANATLRAVTTATPNTVLITPIQASVNSPRYTTKDIGPIYAGSAPADIWTITDRNGDAVDLSAKSLKFVTATVDYDAEKKDPFDVDFGDGWSYESGDGIAVGGDDNNLVTVTQDADDVVAGSYRYWLLNVTDREPLATGRMPVQAIADGAWD